MMCAASHWAIRGQTGPRHPGNACVLAPADNELNAEGSPKVNAVNGSKGHKERQSLRAYGRLCPEFRFYKQRVAARVGQSFSALVMENSSRTSRAVLSGAR